MPDGRLSVNAAVSAGAAAVGLPREMVSVLLVLISALFGLNALLSGTSIGAFASMLTV